jgi:hypothetical protein
MLLLPASKHHTLAITHSSTAFALLQVPALGLLQLPVHDPTNARTHIHKYMTLRSCVVLHLNNRFEQRPPASNDTVQAPATHLVP